jgi:hypothetical protein
MDLNENNALPVRQRKNSSIINLKSMVVEGMGKSTFKCDMCRSQEAYKPRYRWVGMITEKELNICRKCAVREHGSKRPLPEGP